MSSNIKCNAYDTNLLQEMETIKTDGSLSDMIKRLPKEEQEDMWLKLRGAFEANDVETLEEIEKKLAS